MTPIKIKQDEKTMHETIKVKQIRKNTNVYWYQVNDMEKILALNFKCWLNREKKILLSFRMKTG